MAFTTRRARAQVQSHFNIERHCRRLMCYPQARYPRTERSESRPVFDSQVFSSSPVRIACLMRPKRRNQGLGQARIGETASAVREPKPVLRDRRGASFPFPLEPIPETGVRVVARAKARGSGCFWDRLLMMAGGGTVSAAAEATVPVVSVTAVPIGGTVGEMAIRAAMAEARPHGMRAVRERRPVVIPRAIHNSWGIVTGRPVYHSRPGVVIRPATVASSVVPASTVIGTSTIMPASAVVSPSAALGEGGRGSECAGQHRRGAHDRQPIRS